MARSNTPSSSNSSNAFWRNGSVLARVLGWICRLALAGIFLYAGFVKLYPTINLYKFMMDISTYQLLPDWGVQFVAYTLPPFEVALGLLLLSGWKLRYSAAVAGALLTAFMVAMGITYARGIEAACGCFGSDEIISPYTLARDSGILLMAIFLTVHAWRSRPAPATPAG